MSTVEFCIRLSQVEEELIDTECAYVANLERLLEAKVALEKFHDGAFMRSAQSIFSNLQALITFHRAFSDELRSCCQSGESPAEVFLRNGALLRMYKEYAENYDRAMGTINVLERREKQFRAYLNHARKKILKQPLESFLIRPIQHIPRYKLLAQQVLKLLPEDDDRRDAYEAMDQQLHEFALYLDEQKRSAERSIQLVKVQAKLKGCDKFLQSNRRLLNYANVEIRKFGKDRKRRVLFLFSDLVMWTTEKYQFRDVMFLSSLLDLGEVAPMPMETPTGGKKSKPMPAKAAIFLKDPMLGRVTIEFASREDRDVWLADIQDQAELEVESTANRLSQLLARRRTNNDFDGSPAPLAIMRRHTFAVSNEMDGNTNTSVSSPATLAREAASRARFASSETPPELDYSDRTGTVSSPNSTSGRSTRSPILPYRTVSSFGLHRSLPAPLSILTSSFQSTSSRSLFPSPTYSAGRGSADDVESIPSVPTPRGAYKNTSQDSHSNLGTMRRNSIRYQSLRRLGARVSLFSAKKSPAHSLPQGFSHDDMSAGTHRGQSLQRTRTKHRRNKSTIPRSRSNTAYFAPYDDTRSVTSDEGAASRRKRLSPSIFSAPELCGDESGATSDATLEEFPLRPSTPSACSSIDGVSPIHSLRSAPPFSMQAHPRGILRSATVSALPTGGPRGSDSSDASFKDFMAELRQKINARSVAKENGDAARTFDFAHPAKTRSVTSAPAKARTMTSGVGTLSPRSMRARSLTAARKVAPPRRRSLSPVAASGPSSPVNISVTKEKERENSVHHSVPPPLNRVRLHHRPSLPVATQGRVHLTVRSRGSSDSGESSVVAPSSHRSSISEMSAVSNSVAPDSQPSTESGKATPNGITLDLVKPSPTATSTALEVESTGANSSASPRVVTVKHYHVHTHRHFHTVAVPSPTTPTAAAAVTAGDHDTDRARGSASSSSSVSVLHLLHADALSKAAESNASTCVSTTTETRSRSTSENDDGVETAVSNDSEGESSSHLPEESHTHTHTHTHTHVIMPPRVTLSARSSVESSPQLKVIEHASLDNTPTSSPRKPPRFSLKTLKLAHSQAPCA